jgi:hypothetical protein
MNKNAIKKRAKELGFEFNDADCDEIIKTSFKGESVDHAVKDFIDAYEGGCYAGQEAWND